MDQIELNDDELEYWDDQMNDLRYSMVIKVAERPHPGNAELLATQIKLVEDYLNQNSHMRALSNPEVIYKRIKRRLSDNPPTEAEEKQWLQEDLARSTKELKALREVASHRCKLCGSPTSDKYCTHDGYKLCHGCMLGMSGCRSCDNYCPPQDRKDGLCPACYIEPAKTRPYGVRTDKAKGKIIKHDRPFGVEVECLVPESTIGSWKNPRGFTNGTDGSIQNRGNEPEARGIEFRSDPLSGKSGEKLLVDFCSQLKKHQAFTNSSCGLHIHLDTGGIARGDVNVMKNIFMFYVAFNDVIMAMLPPYRRENRYARNMSRMYSLGEIARANSLQELYRIWYGRTRKMYDIKDDMRQSKHNTRYCGINLHLMFAPNSRTLEIRYHSPTLIATKILQWVSLHQHILEHVPKHGPLWTDMGSGIGVVPANGLEAFFFEDKLKLFFKIIKAPIALREYVVERIETFNHKNMPETLTRRRAKKVTTGQAEPTEATKQQEVCVA